ncbi:hypothetical protein [Rhizobium alvei]|uniref:Lipoprotein n=1 Tax=Rhizobium alvei TaxID=1132659 RepID=A0ABT8YNN5_9HYPH|nr:hypothetical protein [Rhizobium alvei]MDO6965234.1 hypothetical protein [Rhizobium alvei]
MTNTRLAFALLLAIMVAGCTVMIDTKFEPVGVVNSKPGSNIYPDISVNSTWMKYDAVIDKDILYSARRSSATISIELNDCKGLHIYNLDLYVKDVSIFQVGSMDGRVFDSILSSPSKNVIVSFYIKTDMINRSRNSLCVKFRGGGPLGPKISSKLSILK